MSAYHRGQPIICAEVVFTLLESIRGSPSALGSLSGLESSLSQFVYKSFSAFIFYCAFPDLSCILAVSQQSV